MPRRIALIVGMSDYHELPRLSNTTRDAEAMAEVFRSISKFDEIETHVNVDHARLAELVELLFAEKERDDLVLFYFSGHGIKDDRGHLYLATPRTRRHPSGELVRSSAVACRHIHEAMTASRSRRQVVILDCCFSGAFAEGLQAKDSGQIDLLNQLGGVGRAVLASSSSTEYSFDPAKERLSTYTQCLVHGMASGEADLNHDGVITIDELHEYARARVRTVNPAMNPQILPIREGFKIIISEAPQADPRRAYAAKVRAVADPSGQIPATAMQVLTLLRQQVNLSVDDARRIEEAELAPLRLQAANRETLKRAVIEARRRRKLREELPLLNELRVALNLGEDDLREHLDKPNMTEQVLRLGKSRGVMGIGAGTVSLGLFGMLAWWGFQGESPMKERAPQPSPPVSQPTTPSSSLQALPHADDSYLNEVLAVDHTRTEYGIRITADNTLGEAREHARSVLRNSRFQPWIVHEVSGRRLFYVFVGAYTFKEAANGDQSAARAIEGEGAIVVSLRNMCSRIEWNPAGYHDCF